MNSHQKLARFVAPGVLVTLLAAGEATALADPPAPPSRPGLPTGAPYTHGTYVAMGDSRAAGGSATLTADYQLNPCRRSGDNYPSMVRDRIKPRTYIDISCIGAKSANLRNHPQMMGLRQTNDPLGSMTGSMTGSLAFPIAAQLPQVPRTAQVITVSTGGNDLDWAEILKKCNIRARKNCSKNPAIKARARQGLSRLTVQATTSLRAIRGRAPQAQIFTVGLGGFIGKHGCRQVQLSTADAVWFNNLFKEANTRLRAATEGVGGKLIDVTDPGHDACSGRAWFFGRNAPQGNMAFHLNTTGRAVVANRIAGSIRR
ncbi:SGNH/GDSL hydrolase family protein [Gordonia sp. (in: high G+C Gram-positive bacteria)]|uniref:SGNH/GDSL hydrolase family protein n=1 Tax=Gordonia sp. (in: high G+C Gram-positive bacteria) TaxID=84139 RepID=UPI0039E37334